MAIERLSTEDAEKIAIAGLAFLAESPDHLARFLAASGLGPQTLRAAAADPSFLAAVLEFLMSDDSLVVEFAERQGLRPTLIALARHRLDGYPSA